MPNFAFLITWLRNLFNKSGESDKEPILMNDFELEEDEEDALFGL